MIDTPRPGQYEVVPARSPLAEKLADAAPRTARTREYLMCPPERFAVEYAINPWMHVGEPVDAELAVKQWRGLRETLVRLGHTVRTLDPIAGLPDMVYAANGAFTVDGVVYGARFRYEQRRAEAGYHRAWYLANGWTDYRIPDQTNEGEGDFAYLPAALPPHPADAPHLPDAAHLPGAPHLPGAFQRGVIPPRREDGRGAGMILAGYGFRTSVAAHAEVQEALGRPVISLRLVDPRFYHLDTALAALDDRTIAYFPGAFSPASQRVLRQLFPDALVADEADALAFGLNVVSDSRNVVLNSTATGLVAKLAERGYHPVPVELTELHNGGGSVKCCVAELRR